jgi:hypothetical protein
LSLDTISPEKFVFTIYLLIQLNLEVVEAKKPLAILAIQAAGLVLFGLSDSVISIVDTSNSKSEVIGNSSASATITITMYAMASG